MAEDDLISTKREARLSLVEEADVVVVPYDPRWVSRYATEALVVASAFNNRHVAIEHFGSTAVPGLAAKPIIDILVGSFDSVPPSAAEIQALAAEHYEYLGEDGRRPGRWFWRKRQSAAFNLSFVPLTGPLWQDNLVVRDYLRTAPNEVEAYATIKQEAVQHSPDSLLGYQNHKRSFMEGLRSRARNWAGAQTGKRGRER